MDGSFYYWQNLGERLSAKPGPEEGTDYDQAERPRFITNPDNPRYNAHSSTMRVLLGLTPKAKLPAEGMPPRIIQGFKVWVEPKLPGRKIHRVLAECPQCKQVMSAGRLHQHVCKTPNGTEA